MIPPLTAHKGKVIDDRGVAGDLVPRAEFNDDPRQLDPRFRAVAERYRTELSSRTERWVMLAAIVPVIAVSISGGLRALPWYASYSILLFVISLVSFVQIRIATRRGTVPAAQALIAASLCPRCAYSLHGLPIEPDGCTVCAECGAAWLNTRILDEQPYESAARVDASTHTKRWLGWLLGTGRTQSIMDESRVQRTIVRTNLKREIAAATDPDIRQRLQDAARANIRKGRIARWATVALLTAVPVFMLIMMLNVMSALGRAGVGTGAVGGVSRIALTPILISVFYLFIIIRVLRNGNGVSPKAFRNEMLKRDLCPSCAADLRTVEPIPNSNNTVCPRCTATWNRPLRYDPVPPE